MISSEMASDANNRAKQTGSNWIRQACVMPMVIVKMEGKISSSGSNKGAPLVEVHFQDPAGNYDPIKEWWELTGPKKEDGRPAFWEVNIGKLAKVLNCFGTELKPVANVQDVVRQFAPFIKKKQLAVAIRVREKLYEKDGVWKKATNASAWYFGPIEELQQMTEGFDAAKATTLLDESQIAMLNQPVNASQALAQRASTPDTSDMDDLPDDSADQNGSDELEELPEETPSTGGGTASMSVDTDGGLDDLPD